MRPRINILGAQIAANILASSRASDDPIIVMEQRRHQLEAEHQRVMEHMRLTLKMEAEREAYAREHGPYALGFEIVDKDPNVSKLEIPWRYQEDRMFFDWATQVVNAPGKSMKNVSPYRVWRRRMRNKAARSARRRNRKKK